MKELVTEFGWLRRQLFDRHVTVHDTGCPKDAVNRALEFLQGTALEVRTRARTRSEKMAPDAVTATVTVPTDKAVEDIVLPLPVHREREKERGNGVTKKKPEVAQERYELVCVSLNIAPPVVIGSGTAAPCLFPQSAAACVCSRGHGHSLSRCS
jgi:hypothetical protein